MADQQGEWRAADEAAAAAAAEAEEKAIKEETRAALRAAASEIAALAIAVAADEGDSDPDEKGTTAERAYREAGGPTGFQGWSAVIDEAVEIAIDAIHEGNDPTEAVLAFADADWHDD
jgi:hypothetical protein